MRGIAFPEVHSAKKTLDTKVLPEKQKPLLQDKQVVEKRPRLGQGRAGIRHKKPQPAEEIGDALIEHVVRKYCVLDCIIMDQDSTFMSSLINYLFNKLNVKIKTVVPYNHQLLQAKHGIKSLSRILMRDLTNLGQMWPKYLLLATFAYNTFNSLTLANYSQAH